MTFRYRSKISLLTCLFLQTTICGFAQLINGQVVDFATRKPIMYVNIGILGSSVGTISNDDGTFSIKVPSEYSEASVIFSMLGYEPREIPVQRLVDQIIPPILLKEKPTRLETVTITGKEKKANAKKQRELFIELSTDEKQIVQLLQQNEVLHIDEINISSGLSSSAIAAAILNLELQGVVGSMPGKLYKLI